jgi:hypothetical protein
MVSDRQARWDGFRAAREGKMLDRELGLDPNFKALHVECGFFSAAEGR